MNDTGPPIFVIVRTVGYTCGGHTGSVVVATSVLDDQVVTKKRPRGIEVSTGMTCLFEECVCPKCGHPFKDRDMIPRSKVEALIEYYRHNVPMAGNGYAIAAEEQSQFIKKLKDLLNDTKVE